MSSQLKKKNKKKKKKNLDEEILPKKHERVENLNYYSEEISKIIIEKIISCVLSSSLNKNNEKIYGDICYQSTKRMINNIMELTYVNHDNDDFDIDKIEINTYVKYYNTDTNYKRYFIKRHDIAWKKRNLKAENSLLKPFKNKKIEERLNKSAIVYNNKYISKGNIYQYSINPSKNNFWGHIPNPKVSFIDRTSSNYNNYIPRKEESNKNINETKKKSTVLDKNKLSTKTKTFSYRNFISKLSKNFSISKDKGNNTSNNFLEIINQKRRAPQMIDMPSYPLINLEVRKELDEIDDLRKEAEEIISKKEKVIIKKSIAKQEKTKEDLEKEKKIKNGKFTYDNEGNLIIINEIRQDRLSKEFWPIMTKQKEIKQGKTLEAYKNENIKMKNKAEKNIAYNKGDQKLETLLIKARLTEPLINLNYLNNLNDSIKDIFKDNNRDNPNDSAQSAQKKFTELILLSQMNKPKIEPSGSNFKLINPSVGVKIKEKTKIKSGGIDFYSQFHKYSVNDFNKTLQDTLEWSKLKLKEKTKEDFNPTATAELPNLKKNNFIKKMIKEEKEQDQDEEQENSQLNPNNIKYEFNRNFTNSRARKRNKDIINNLENTASSVSNIKSYNTKKNMLKSASEIILENEKLMKLKEVLFHENENKITRIDPYRIKPKEKDNLFEFRNQSSLRQRNKKIQELKKKFNDIDNFNKNIITGKATYNKINNSKMVLPKLSVKNNETNFNKTMLNFVRERTKKIAFEEYIQKKENTSKRKKIKKINIAKKSD